VQVFEQALARISLVLDAGLSSRRRFKTAEQADVHFQKTLQQVLHRHQRASASELRKMLPDDFDQELKSEIDALIKWRDLLAHRYLVWRIGGNCGGSDWSSIEELLTVAKDFVAVTRRLQDAFDIASAGWPECETSSAVREFTANLTQPIMFGNPGEHPPFVARS
jgi:hypothetical protein